ncbi:putative inactive carboxylesterase 4 isoform X2 [Halyomorpha halys]|uniref:putative inactive carboxylesterase 4 isoform X2 n=1 Tax=Halyomorpha halys TaxID=286706 RepID=UPI0006D504BC|nr:putative inactive carboxylesterase 4 isoform X2 [Halyomorpha halys]
MPLIHLLIMLQVSTKNGKLKGDFVRKQFDVGYYVFRNIPYANLINNNSSLKYPQPITKWEEVKDSTIGPQSSQGNATNEIQENRNCLHLTIYTRKIRRWLPPSMARTYQVSPVEVYFLGCTINSGENRTESVTGNILKEDVVKVMVSHRRGIPVSTEDIAENDQLLALQWIKDNILYFGGDPQRVAVFQGHSGLADIDINRLSLRANGT